MAVLFNSAFLIFVVNHEDKVLMPNQLLPYSGNAATYVGASIVMAREMFDTPRARKYLRRLASALHPKLNADSLVGTFIDKLYEQFLPVFVDYSMTNPDVRGGHFRREYNDEGGNGFDTLKQGILLNGLNVRAMCKAGVRAETHKDPELVDSARFKSHLFATANTLFHELTHVFVTFLGQGRTETPPEFLPRRDAQSSQHSAGAAGEWLEENVFGGQVVIMRDPNVTGENKDQAGICYLHYRFTKRIKQETIDDIVRFKFEFPIEDLGETWVEGLKTMGAHLPGYHPSDPMNSPEIRSFLQAYKQNPARFENAVRGLIVESTNPVTFNDDHKSILRRVPDMPELVVDPAAN